MRQTGVVVKTEGIKAVVSVKRTAGCGENCAMCKGACTLQVISAETINKIGAKTGDLVVLEADSKSVLKGAFALYMLPVLMLIAAYIISESFLKSSKIAVLLSLGVLLVSYALIKIFEKKLLPKTYITEIYKEEV